MLTRPKEVDTRTMRKRSTLLALVLIQASCADKPRGLNPDGVENAPSRDWKIHPNLSEPEVRLLAVNFRKSLKQKEISENGWEVFKALYAMRGFWSVYFVRKGESSSGSKFVVIVNDSDRSCSLAYE